MTIHDAVLQLLAEKLSPRIVFSASRLHPVARELDGYFAGTRHQFDLPLDFSLSRGFRVIVPCHRVVKSDGSFGDYLGGTEAKRALLALEAA
jgi:methylated-DNA-[protein]-cysteine S-methyltransferase